MADLGSTDHSRRVYEIVSGQVLLAKRPDFVELHHTIFLPLAKKLGIRTEGLFLVDVGTVGRFFDIYSYDSYTEVRAP